MKSLEEKLDKIDERLNSIDVTLTKQNAQLEHHIYRSDLNEENIEILRAEVKPLVKAHAQVNGFLKFVGGLAVVAGMVKAFIEIFKLVS